MTGESCVARGIFVPCRLLLFVLASLAAWGPVAAAAEPWRASTGALTRPARLAPAATSAPPPPNILFLLSDDQRPDTIHALGNDIIETPNLDRLVAQGVAFTRAICANPICTPSRAEIASGMCGFHNGVTNFGQRLPPAATTWAQVMQAGGYHTWFVGKADIGGRPKQYGYQASAALFMGGGARWAREQVDWKGIPATGYRGWVFQDDAGKLFPEQGIGLTTNTSRQIADGAIRFIRQRPDSKPYFLHVNFTAPHDPLLMPPEYAAKYHPAKIPLPANFLPQHPFDHGNLLGRDELTMNFPRTPSEVRGELACYYAVITQLDAEIGRILAALDETGQAANTLVIFASDHGVAIGSHGLRGKQNMYEHTIGVPLVMRGPGIPQGKRMAAQVYLRDLYPTACDLAGLAIPQPVEGHSLRPVIEGRSECIYPEVFGYYLDFQRMIRTDRWKLIDYPKIQRTQLFDLARDPAEMHDHSAHPQYAGVLADMRTRLFAEQQAHGDPLAKKVRSLSSGNFHGSSPASASGTLPLPAATD